MRGERGKRAVKTWKMAVGLVRRREEEEEEGRGEINSLEKPVYWLCLGASILKVYVYNKSLIKTQN